MERLRKYWKTAAEARLALLNSWPTTNEIIYFTFLNGVLGFWSTGRQLQKPG